MTIVSSALQKEGEENIELICVWSVSTSEERKTHLLGLFEEKSTNIRQNCWEGLGPQKQTVNVPIC